MGNWQNSFSVKLGGTGWSFIFGVTIWHEENVARFFSQILYRKGDQLEMGMTLPLKKAREKR